MNVRLNFLQPALADDSLDQAADDFSARAGALADLLQRWRKPNVARTVIKSLLADDGDTFRELLRDFEPPVLGKCFWVREIVEKIVAATEYRTVCRLRTNLTPDERQLYLSLALRFRRQGAHAVFVESRDEMHLTGLVGPVVPPGPFLETLRAQGLVVCTEEPVEGAGLQQLLGPPARICV